MISNVLVEMWYTLFLLFAGLIKLLYLRNDLVALGQWTQSFWLGSLAREIGQMGCVNSSPACTYVQLNLCKGWAAAHVCMHASPPLLQLELCACMCTPAGHSCGLIANRPWFSSGLQPGGLGPLLYVTQVLGTTPALFSLSLSPSLLRIWVCFRNK